VNVFLCTPTVPEQTDRHEQRAVYHRGQAELRLHHSIILLREMYKDLIASNTKETHTNYRTYHHSYKSKASGTSREVVLFLEDDGEGGEKEVEVTINDGHMDGQEEGDRACEKHF
jgi:hypothetical protein